MADFNNITSFVLDETQYDYSSDPEKVLTQGDLTLAVYDLLSTNPSFNKGFDYIFSCLCDNYDVYSSEYYTGVLDSSGGGEMGVVNLKTKNSLKLYERMKSIHPNIVQTDTVDILPDLSDLENTQLITCGDFVAPIEVLNYVPRFIPADDINISFSNHDNIWKNPSEFYNYLNTNGFGLGGYIAISPDMGVPREIVRFSLTKNQLLYCYGPDTFNFDLYHNSDNNNYNRGTINNKGCIVRKNSNIDVSHGITINGGGPYNNYTLKFSTDTILFERANNEIMVGIDGTNISDIKRCRIFVKTTYLTPMTYFNIMHELVKDVDLTRECSLLHKNTRILYRTSLSLVYNGNETKIGRVGTQNLLNAWGSNMYRMCLPVITHKGFRCFLLSDDYDTINSRYNSSPDNITITLDDRTASNLLIFTMVEYVNSLPDVCSIQLIRNNGQSSYPIILGLNTIPVFYDDVLEFNIKNPSSKIYTIDLIINEKIIHTIKTNSIVSLYRIYLSTIGLEHILNSNSSSVLKISVY